MEMARARELIAEVRAAHLPLVAAAVAYNAFLALVPSAAGIVGVAALLGGDEAATTRVRDALAPIAPAAAVDFVISLMADAQARLGGRGLLLAGGSTLVALFIGSRAVVALKRGLALVSGAVETRPALQARLVGAALTAGAGLTLLVVSTVLVAGRQVFAFAGGLVGWEGLGDLWAGARVLVAGAGLFAFLLAFYRWAPTEPVPRAALAAAMATGGIVVVSLGFALYLAVSPALGATFGALGAVWVLMVWLYLGALTILVSGLAVATIDRAR